MKFLRCECGNRTAWSSMSTPRCTGCTKCGKTLAESKRGHCDTEAHEPVPVYGRHSGTLESYECRVCGWAVDVDGLAIEDAIEPQGGPIESGVSIPGEPEEREHEPALVLSPSRERFENHCAERHLADAEGRDWPDRIRDYT